MASPGEEAIAVRLSKLSLTSKDSSSLINNNEPTKQFTFQELDKITDNCSKDRFLGQGGFATVYKGVLDDGEEIAVKYLHNSAQTDEDFNREFDNIRKLNHPNIVRLVAYSFETQHQPRDFKGKLMFGESIRRALCFEFMRNGSLQEKLFDESRGLDWEKRYKIIKGACEGLKYLHGLSNPIFHLDLKPDNILLDENLTAKLADFGVSKRRSTDQTMVTKDIAGTIAYMAPEYLHDGELSNKADVFSLGVVIAQIIGGREGKKRIEKRSKEEFREEVYVNWRNRLEETYDTTPKILQAYYDQVVECTEIAVSSMEDERENRPTIAKIVSRLDVTEAAIKKAIAWSEVSRSSVLPAKSQREQDVHMPKLEVFLWKKAIHFEETCDKFPVLVRVTAEEMARPAGIDIVVVINCFVKSIMPSLEFLIDMLNPNDRLSIWWTPNYWMELTYMSDHGRTVARKKINSMDYNLRSAKTRDPGLKVAAQILRQRGAEENRRRPGCIVQLWDVCNAPWGHHEIYSQEFPVHIVQIRGDERSAMKRIAATTSGTYTVTPDYSVHNLYHLPALFFPLSATITLQPDEGVTISSITPSRYGNLVSPNKQSATVYLHNIYVAFVVYLTVPQGKEKLLTIGGKYLCRDKLVTVDVDVAVLRPRRKCLPDEVVIHPKVVAELLRIQLMEGIAKGHRRPRELFFEEIKNSDEGRAAPEEILSDLEDEVAQMTDRYGDDKEALLSSLNCNQMQRSITEVTSPITHASQILNQQRSDVLTNMVKVKVFTRSKGILHRDTCEEFPVLVRVTMAPWCHGWEMPRNGVDVVAVLDIGENMHGDMLKHVKQAMMIVMDKLGPGSRLSIVSSQTRNHRFMELTYMSGEHGDGRDDAMYKISQLRATGRCTGHIASAALQIGFQILRDRGEEESSSRLGCMILLSDGNYPEILQLKIDPEFPVHTFGLGADHNPKVMKYIADKTSGTYSFIDMDISNIKDAITSFITGLTSIAATSIKIILGVHYDIAIKSIESGNYIHNVESDKMSGTIIIDHIYAGEQKEFIVNLKVGTGRKDLMSIGGQYKSFERVNSIGKMDVSVLRPWYESPEDKAIHPDVAAELVRIRLRNGILDMVEKQKMSTQGLQKLWNMIKNSDEAHAARVETLSGLSREVAEMNRDIPGMPYTLSWLSCHKWQRETTKGTPRNSSVFRTIGQYTDDDTNMVKVETFTISKAIPSDDPCNKFPVLVRVMVTPQQQAMMRAGVDVVVVLDASGGMQGEKLEHMKEAMMVVVDNLCAEDRLSIVSFNTYENRLTRLTYMTELGRDVAKHKINKLAAGGQGDIAAALRKGAEILSWREAESRRRVGCIMFVSGCKNNGIFETEIRPEFPVHTFGLDTDHNPNMMKYIADITSGTYSFVNQDIGMIKEALTVFITSLKSVSAMSIKITLRAKEGITISSIESRGYISHVENNQFGTIDIDNIYASGQKDFIVYLTVAEGKKELITIGGRYLSHDTVKHLAYTDVSVQRPPQECLPDDLAFQPEVAAELVRIKLEKVISTMLDEEPSSIGLQHLWEEIMDTDEGRATPAETLSGISMEVAEMKRGIENPKEYRKSGLPYTLSWLTSRRWRRATIKDTPSHSDAFQTTGKDADGRATPSK